MYKSTFAKYLTIISLVVVLGFLAMTTFQVLLTSSTLAEDKRALLLENAQNIADYTAASADLKGQHEGIPIYNIEYDEEGARILMSVADAIDATVLITDGAGKVLWTAGELQDEQLKKEASLGSVLHKIDDDFYEIGNLNGFYKERHYTVAVPVSKDGKVLGYVFASSPANMFVQTLRSNLRIYLYSVLAAVYYSSPRISLRRSLTVPQKPTSRTTSALK